MTTISKKKLVQAISQKFSLHPNDVRNVVQEFLDLVKDTGFKILRFYEQREKDRFSRKNWIIKIKKNNLYKK